MNLSAMMRAENARSSGLRVSMDGPLLSSQLRVGAKARRQERAKREERVSKIIAASAIVEVEVSARTRMVWMIDAEGVTRDILGGVRFERYVAGPMDTKLASYRI